jgi:hypothetical protein
MAVSGWKAAQSNQNESIAVAGSSRAPVSGPATARPNGSQVLAVWVSGPVPVSPCLPGPQVGVLDQVLGVGPVLGEPAGQVVDQVKGGQGRLQELVVARHLPSSPTWTQPADR